MSKHSVDPQGSRDDMFKTTRNDGNNTLTQRAQVYKNTSLNATNRSEQNGSNDTHRKSTSSIQTSNSEHIPNRVRQRVTISTKKESAHLKNKRMILRDRLQNIIYRGVY